MFGSTNSRRFPKHSGCGAAAQVEPCDPPYELCVDHTVALERIIFYNTQIYRATSMKPFAFLAGFLILTTAVAVPFLLKKKVLATDGEVSDDMRYDINEYMAAEGL